MSVLLASYALTGGRGALEIIRGGFALIPASVRGMGWAADGSRAGQPEGQRWVGRVASGANGVAPLDMALEVAEETGLPVMAHLDHAPPSRLEVLSRLRPGDV